MLKLWHKYALALFSASVIPLGVAGWQIAGSGSEEVALGARRYHIAVGDLGLRVVREYLELAVAEAKGIIGTLATPSIPADVRFAFAQNQLIAATRLRKLVVYAPDGQDVEHMAAAGTDGAAALDGVDAPALLSESLRVQTHSLGHVFGAIITTAKGERFLPILVRALKASGEVHSYGWTVVALDPLNALLGEQSERHFAAVESLSLIDGAFNVIAQGDPARVGKAYAETGADLGINDAGDLKKDRAFTFRYQTAAGEERIGALTPVTDIGWGVVVEQPLAEVMAPVSRIWTTTFMVGGAFAVIALLLGILAGRRFSAPIVALSKAAGTVAKGDFSARVIAKGSDEVGQLGNAFDSMAGQLSATVEELKEVTATRERMQTELDIGRKIQMSMIPLNFPAFPERPEFDIHAALHPAFEVGGDFYDFFLIDDSHLCVVVADVSGKGVPAALFMAVTRTLVKAHAHGGATSEEIVEKVNDDLAMDNEACMFVTVFLGILEIETGRLVFTNAGHNPSYVKRLSGKVERLDKLHGPVVAAMEEIPYGQGETTLAPGEAIFMYTDGVNEAMNAKEELFTEERLAKLLEDDKFTSSKATVKVVLDDVWKFQGAADQSDDVTVVALRYLGPQKKG